MPTPLRITISETEDLTLQELSVANGMPHRTKHGWLRLSAERGRHGDKGEFFSLIPVSAAVSTGFDHTRMARLLSYLLGQQGSS